MSNKVLIAEEYERKEGLATVPKSSGFGLAIDEKAFNRDVRIRFDVS